MRKAIFALSAALCVAACGGDDDQQAVITTTDSASMAAPRLTEAEVVGTLLAATESLALADSAALGVVTQPSVLRYAEVLRADHRAIAAEVKAVADSIGVSGAQSEVGERLRTEASDLMNAMRDTTGNTASAFIDRQLEVQRHLVGALDSALIPAATTPQLRQVLQDLRPAMVAHLQRAEQIKQMLSQATTAPRTGAASIPASAARRDTTATVSAPSTGGLGATPPARPDTLAPPDTIPSGALL